MRNRFSALCLLAFTFPALAAAQVVETPDGRVVEFVGLEQWTVERIQQEMATRAPGQSLGTCTGVLKGLLGFPEAQALQMEVGGKHYSVVTVIEPQHADRVRKKPAFLGSRGDVPEWREALDILDRQISSFMDGVSRYPFHRMGVAGAVTMLPPPSPEEYAAMERLWRFLDQHRSAADHELALWTLDNDGNHRNRVVAAAILSSFGQSDLAWWTLADALRDPHAWVAATANHVISGLGKGAQRRVDWRPALPSLRALLQGTYVSGFKPLLRALVDSGISPDLAGELLADGGGDLLLAYLRAQNEIARQPAHAFLVHLSGKDLGADPGAWKAWMDGLAKKTQSLSGR